MLRDLNLRLTPHRTLTIVLGLRGIAIAAQLALVALAVQVFHIVLPVNKLLFGIAILALAAAGLAWRLRRRWPATELEVSAHLLVDIVVLTWLLYHAGGPSNPFISAYLVPIALAASALRLAHGLLISAAGIAAYTLLLAFDVPVPAVHLPEAAFALHVFGMWANFILSAGLIAGLLWLMAENIRRRDRQIAEAREAALRNEHVVALGALAAGAAHELSTPLSTVALLADELALQLQDKPGARADVALLKAQIQQCKTSLSSLLASAGHARVESTPVAVDAFLQTTLERWRLLRPEVTLQIELTGDASARLRSDPGVAQTLINLLNNAADASLAAGRQQVSLKARAHENRVIIDIEDQGPGVDAAAQAVAGRVVFSTKAEGKGLGLLLSNASLERLGGRLTLHRRAEGGTLTRVVLPAVCLTPVSTSLPHEKAVMPPPADIHET